MERKYKGVSLYSFPKDYTIIDIETTGLLSGINEIIEVAALKVRNDTVTESFSSLIKPTLKISAFITNLTGITNNMVNQAPQANKVLREFYWFVNKDILMGHNVNFDINFLYDNLLYHNNLILDNPFVDTLRLSRRILPNLENHKQTTIAEYFGIATVGAHRALRDCEICHKCYLNLKRIFNSSTLFNRI